MPPQFSMGRRAPDLPHTSPRRCMSRPLAPSVNGANDEKKEMGWRRKMNLICGHVLSVREFVFLAGIIIFS
jgi:hypothetical protein